MREQLIQYVDLLFAGSSGTEDIKQEILQNTLDRYDDLISQDKTPQAAYSLAISGIGDISELLNAAQPPVPSAPQQPAAADPQADPSKAKLMRAVAIGLYICCVVPVIALGNIGNGIIGVCLMLLMIAAATVLIILSGSKKDENDEKEEENEILTPQQELTKAIDSVSGIVTLGVYLAVSFWSGAWWITWLIFPISGAIKGLIKACIDLKEAGKHEN